METTIFTSREFNHDASRAKRAALQGPVIITERGKPSHVLITIEEYQKLSRGHKSIVDQLACEEAADINFEPGRLDAMTKDVELS